MLNIRAFDQDLCVTCRGFHVGTRVEEGDGCKCVGKENLCRYYTRIDRQGRWISLDGENGTTKIDFLSLETMLDPARREEELRG